jgi:hypothetical protein
MGMVRVGVRARFCVACVAFCAVVGYLGLAGVSAFAVQLPVITGEASSGATSTEVKVSAQIEAGGVPTTYRVEYGTGEAYGSSTPEASLGAPQSAVPVAVQLTGLQPGTEYHFRFVATGALTTLGTDATFTTVTSSASALGLPDGRAYELVTGLGSPGEVIVPEGPEMAATPIIDPSTELPFRASADGSAVAYVGDPGEVGGNGISGSGTGNALIATRDPRQRRWDVSDVTPPPLTEHAEEPKYRAFSGDLSVGVLVEPARGLASIGSEGPAGCEVLYSRTGAGYRALFTETQLPGYCGEVAEFEPSPTGQDLEFAGGNAGTASVPQYSRLLFQTPAPLTEGTELSPEGEGNNLEGEGNNLYESVGGQLHLVSALPDGTRDPNAVFGSPPGARRSQSDFSNVISADGTRMFWTDLTTRGLYVRENPSQPQSPIGAGGECTVPADACTVQLDTTEGPGPSGGGAFWTASADGSRVLFTDCSRLTSDATAISAEGCERDSEEGSFPGQRHRLLTGNDLYEYNFDAPEGKRLTDLTIDANAGDPLRADVQGVVGASEDGSYVYYVAGGALAPGAKPLNCREPTEEEHEKREKGGLSEEEQKRLEAERVQELLGHLPAGRGCNLYVEHIGEPPRLIATLAAKDDHLERSASATEVRLGAWQRELGSRTAEATPSGHQLVFESTQQLTGYDNSLLATENVPGFGEHAAEVFIYDSASGRLLCASCDPRNAPPSPERNAAEETHSGSGTYLPPSLSATSMRRWVSEDGSRVFFDTTQPLVPQDTNGNQDVYEWEREETPGCPSATSRWGGCVFLLSGGNSRDESFLIDADATGDNVFFIHRGGLGQAISTEGKMNVFDARVGGGFSESSLACEGSGCQGVPPAPPIFATPSSATFSGAGNFPPPSPAVVKPKKTVKCSRGKKLSHGKCVKAKSKRKAKRAKRASNHRRGKS